MIITLVVNSFSLSAQNQLVSHASLLKGFKTRVTCIMVELFASHLVICCLSSSQYLVSNSQSTLYCVLIWRKNYVLTVYFDSLNFVENHSNNPYCLVAFLKSTEAAASTTLIAVCQLDAPILGRYSDTLNWHQVSCVSKILSNSQPNRAKLTTGTPSTKIGISNSDRAYSGSFLWKC